MKDSFGLLPLHLAAATQASAEVVAALLSAHPEGAGVQDKDGWLPLHFAATSEAPCEVAALLRERRADTAA